MAVVAEVSNRSIAELISLAGRTAVVRPWQGHRQAAGRSRGECRDRRHRCRVGMPDDIARVALFCASDLALFMTGSTLLVDAGETI